MSEESTSISQEYIDSLRKIDRSPSSFEDVQARAQELAKYIPAQRKMSIYDLASSLSRGLMQSDRTTAIGYGLAAGFDLFNQEAQRRRNEADKMRQELLLMARKEVDEERANDVRLQEAGLEADFKLKLERIKQGDAMGGIFQGKGDLASALNYILRAQTDPSLKNTPEYRAAVLVASKPRQQVVQTEEGAKVVMVPGIDVSVITGDSETKKPEQDIPDGFTFTGKYVDGKPVYRNADGQEGFLQ
jgi:hypothetical protein